MADISHRNDIIRLVDTFYNKALTDEEIGHIFSQTIAHRLEAHLPRIYDFWESALFHTATYKGNPMLVHIDLNKTIPLHASHFDRWITLWNQTVEELYDGEIATAAISKAAMMKDLMIYKIRKSSDPGFIQ